MNTRTARLATTSITLALWAIVCGNVGCSDDKIVRPELQPKYAPSSTPHNTLANMAKAYETRDSTGYDSLFDAAYTGTSFDPNTMLGLSFTKADEAQHIAKLASTPTIFAVTFEYPVNAPRFRDGADPPGWATITLTSPLIEIYDASNVLLVDPNVSMEFKFSPTTPSPGSPTDTTWHIVRWVEIPGSGSGP